MSAFAVPMKLDFHAPVLVSEDFFARRPDYQRALGPGNKGRSVTHGGVNLRAYGIQSKEFP